MPNEITTKNITEEATKALILLDSDPKMQKALETYQKLPEKDQNILLLLMGRLRSRRRSCTNKR